MNLRVLNESVSDRTKGVGGSDVGAIIGLKPFGKTAYDVWLEKTGRVAAQPDNPYMRRGRLLERVVVDMIAQEEALAITPPVEVIHPDHPWIVSHLDGLAESKKTIIEAKTAGAYRGHEWGDAGTDDIPASYIAQVAWYMLTLDWDRAIIGVLIGGEDFRVYRVGRDKTLEEFLFEQAEKFWRENVKGDTPPALEASPTVDRYIKGRFPRDIAEVRVSTGTEDLIVRSYAAARKQFEAAEALKEKYEAELKLAIGEAAGIQGEWGSITWKKTKDSVKVDWYKVAQSLNPPESLVSLHSETRPGSRRFLAKLSV